MTSIYQICTRCIMDTTDPDIEFDEDGVCNHCTRYEERAQRELHYDRIGQEKLRQLVNEIKKNGRNREYDCIIGVSGGVDSTMVAYTVKRLDLRALAIHLNNGWDSEIATNNVQSIVKKLDMDLYTYEVDWEEFRDLQLSFLKASVSNAEIPTDHAIAALLFHTAVEKGLRYIISGGNIVTEGVVPKSWGYYNRDWRFIRGIHKGFGKIRLRNYPHLSLLDWIYYIFVKRIKLIPILNYVPYTREDAKKLIQKELDWKDYGGKHCESVYTRFFQAHILPTKFGFDKRRAHLSNLICSGQTTKEEALQEMAHDPYPREEMMKKDRDYVIRKLGLTEQEFERIMSQPIRTFKHYPNSNFLFSKLAFLVKLAHKTATRNY